MGNESPRGQGRAQVGVVVRGDTTADQALPTDARV